MNPKVFVSHASEDKDRFVLSFAEKLRSKGVDAWVDRWEMYPGDSLVDKIFEEGIKNAQSVIVVLSKYSVGKPWVREELNASMVKKINHGSKLIPVIIDDCAVPECLQSTVWEKINDISNYDTELDRIVLAVYGHSDKPALGVQPSYAQTIIDSLPNLTKTDTLLLKLSCEKAIEQGYPDIDTAMIWNKLKSFDLPDEELTNSLEVLNSKGYINVTRTFSGIVCYRVATYGFDEYSRAYLQNYDTVTESVAFQIVNHNENNNSSISESLKLPQMVVDHILNVFNDKGLIKTSETLGGGMLNIHIYYVSPELKRLLK